MRGEPFHSLPHQEVIRAQHLQLPLRRPEFVIGAATVQKEDGGSNGLFAVLHQGDESPSFSEDLFPNILEELPGLWWKAVALAGLTVQVVEQFNTVAIGRGAEL